MSLRSFERAIAFTLEWEGGLVADPRDRGGVTNHGISQRAYPDLDVRSLTRPEILELYRRDYWDRIRGDELPGVLGFVLLDFAVHSGVRRAARALQLEVGTRADGRIGPITLAAVRRADPGRVAPRLLERRVELLTRLVQSHPDQLAFLTGWMRRTHALAFKAGAYPRE